MAAVFRLPPPIQRRSSYLPTKPPLTVTLGQVEETAAAQALTHLKATAVGQVGAADFQVVETGSAVVTATSQPTASVRLESGFLYFLAVHTHQAGTAPGTISAASSGRTWAPVNNRAFFTNASPHDRLSVLRCQADTDDTDQITITSTATEDFFWWAVVKCKAFLEGSNGAAAALQSAVASSDSTINSTAILGALATDGKNSVIGFGAIAVTGYGAGTPEASWSELLDRVSGSQAEQIVFRHETTDNTARLGASSGVANNSVAAVAVELVLARSIAQPVAHQKSKTLGQVSEADAAQPVTHPRLVHVGQVGETDAAQPLAHTKAHAVGQASETATAQPIAHQKAAAVGQATETATARPVAHALSRTLGQVSESDVAQPVAGSKARDVGQAEETDTAGAVTAARLGAVGQVEETTTAQPVAVSKAAAVGQVGETDEAGEVRYSISAQIGPAEETDEAQPMTFGIRVDVGRAAEADEAMPLSVRHAVHVGQAQEVDAAFAVAVARALSIGRATEQDFALAVRVLLRVIGHGPIGVVLLAVGELAAAMAARGALAASLGQAGGLSAALHGSGELGAATFPPGELGGTFVEGK